MMLARAARSARLAPLRSLRQSSARRMCTAAAEATEEELYGYSIKNPYVAGFLTFFVTNYAMGMRQAHQEEGIAAAKAAILEKKKAAEVVAPGDATVESVVEAVLADPAAVMPTVLKATSTVQDWKVADVTAWLAENEMEQHAEAFKKHSINGKMLLVLEEQDLYKVLNVVSPLHRKKLMMAINELRSSYLNP